MAERIKGVRLYLRERGDAQLLEPLYCDGDPENARQLITQTLALHPKLTGLILLGDWPLTTSKGRLALPDPRRCPTVAIGSSTGARAALRSGRVVALIAPRALEAGRVAVESLEAIRKGERGPFAAPVETGYDVVVRDATGGADRGRNDVRRFGIADFDVRYEQEQRSGEELP